MGVVYRAYDRDLGRDVALKVIRSTVEGADAQSYERRFLNEARAAARLSHPAIVVVHDVGRDTATGALFMALELLRGRTLDAILGEDGPRPWPEALRLVERVAEGLHHAHEHGIVHRDVKPANIMVLASGEPKVMDFGIAKVEASQLTAAGQLFGTPLYMSPEQAQARPVDARSDLFSLGSVLYRDPDGPPRVRRRQRARHRAPGRLFRPSSPVVRRRGDPLERGPGRGALSRQGPATPLPQRPGAGRRREGRPLRRPPARPRLGAAGRSGGYAGLGPQPAGPGPGCGAPEPGDAGRARGGRRDRRVAPEDAGGGRRHRRGRRRRLSGVGPAGPRGRAGPVRFRPGQRGGHAPARRRLRRRSRRLARHVAQGRAGEPRLRALPPERLAARLRRRGGRDRGGYRRPRDEARRRSHIAQGQPAGLVRGRAGPARGPGAGRVGRQRQERVHLGQLPSRARSGGWRRACAAWGGCRTCP